MSSLQEVSAALAHELRRVLRAEGLHAHTSDCAANPEARSGDEACAAMTAIISARRMEPLPDMVVHTHGKTKTCAWHGRCMGTAAGAAWAGIDQDARHA